MGSDAPTAREIVDADGLAVMPGFVGLHTHYVVQVTWDPTCFPSPALGVTTCVIGNCGFGIVPSPPKIRDTIMKNNSVVEVMDLNGQVFGVVILNYLLEGFVVEAEVILKMAEGFIVKSRLVGAVLIAGVDRHLNDG